MTPEEQADALRAIIDQDEMELHFPKGDLPFASSDDLVLRGAVRLINHFGLASDPVLSPEGALEVARVVLEGRPQ